MGDVGERQRRWTKPLARQLLRHGHGRSQGFWFCQVEGREQPLARPDRTRRCEPRSASSLSKTHVLLQRPAAMLARRIQSLNHASQRIQWRRLPDPA